MAPHVNSPSMDTSSLNQVSRGRIHSNGTNGTHKDSQEHQSLKSPHLQYTDDNELHDLVCVGFGPASLAIAIALHDGLDSGNGMLNISSSGGRPLRVAFLERQQKFAWHAGMLLDGAKMQISFIKDMATLRNPRSWFTFINYLHVKGRLVQFTNLNTFLPQRIEFEDYLQWCASWFEDVVRYSQEVIEIRPETSNRLQNTVNAFVVISRSIETGKTSTRRAKHVVVAAGGRPQIPQQFSQSHPRILHSSQYTCQSPQVLTDRQAPYRVAVVGGGQSAAEIFNDLHAKYPNASTRLIVKGTALHPSDDSPFVNEIFDPSRVSPFYQQEASTRTLINNQHKSTNYGVVRLELLEHIYETLYMQRVRYGNEEDWPHRIYINTTVVGVDASRKDVVRLLVTQKTPRDHRYKEVDTETQEYDAVIIGTGYTRDIHEDLLIPARSLLPGGDQPGKKWTVSRDYKVQFEDGMVSEEAGIYLQGCNEQSHGLADSLLSIMAVRGGEIVESIFGNRKGSDHFGGEDRDEWVRDIDTNIER